MTDAKEEIARRFDVSHTAMWCRLFNLALVADCPPKETAEAA